MAADSYRSYHQDYPGDKLARDLGIDHAMQGACDRFSMARWLYEHERQNFSLYMETYIKRFYEEQLINA